MKRLRVTEWETHEAKYPDEALPEEALPEPPEDVPLVGEAESAPLGLVS